MPSAREMMKAELKESVEEAQASKNYKASSYETYFVVPDQRSQWQPEGNEDGVKHYWDCIPFRIGKHFPDKTLKKTPAPGSIKHVMDIHTHRNIGPFNATVICPLNTYKLGKCYSDEEAVELGKVADPEENIVGCPICEHLKAAQSEEPDVKKRKAIWMEKKPYRRVMYNAIVRDGGEEEEKMCQLYEVSHHFMQENLDVISEADERTGKGAVTYPDPDEGKTIKFTYKKSGKGKETTASYEGVEFVDRVIKGKPYVISDEELDDVITLDDTLILMTYKELYDLYWSAEGKRTESSKEEESKKEEEETPPERGSRRLRRTQEAPQEKEEKTEEEVKEKETPPRRLRREESHTEESPVISCPFHYEMGVDTLNKPQCNDCVDEIYKVCRAKKEEFEAAEKPSGRRVLRRS